MGNWYVKGGSDYDNSSCKVWIALFLDGFDEDDCHDEDWKDIDWNSYISTDDPYMRFGSASGGAKEVEIGLYDGRRIKITDSSIQMWQPSGWSNINTDPDAVHVNIANEINQITEKTTPAGADIVIIEDSEASWAKKKITLQKISGDENVDGGRADSTYLPSQIIDGGSA